jgi:peptidoglycan/xylan/chitin deacetylase (PgdA/CDA1 family)
MTWKQVRELHAKGFELGAHTRTHPTLPELALENARSEIVESKQRIEDEVMAPVRFFAYPGGKGGTHYNDRIRAIVEKEFDVCCTTDRGRNSLRKLDLFGLRRICVQRWWSPFYFARELDGTFDFVGKRRISVRAGR